MLAKITSKNQLTLPKSVTQALGPVEYFDVQSSGGQIILTPVRIQRGDAVRAKLAELRLTEADIGAAVTWVRGAVPSAVSAAAAPRGRAGKASAKVVVSRSAAARAKA